MFKSIVCGAAGFQLEEDDRVSPSTLRSGSKTKSKKKKKNKNPYSTRGLDKFSTVVADLGERRQRIYDKVGSQELTMVRFGYSYSRDWKPIVVKLKDNLQDDRNKAQVESDDHNKLEVQKDDKIESIDETKIPQASEMKNKYEVVQLPSNLDQRAKEKKRFSNLIEWRAPFYYFSVLLVLILLCLAIYGRTLAILCTSMWWYLGPIVKCEDNKSRRLMKKKDYVRRFMSDKGMESDAIQLSSRKSRSLQHGLSPIHFNNKSW